MRRLAGLLLPALLALSLLATPALAAAEAAEPAIVLAVESGEPTGPEPSPWTAEENPARELGGYEERELQFTWGAAWLLTVLALGGLALLGGLYYLLVHRPSKESTATR